MAPSAIITDHPGGMNNAFPINAAVTAASGTFQSVNPIHTPSTVAIPFPPLKPRKGEKTCPKIGATEIKYIAGPRIFHVKYASPTGAAALLISRISTNRPTSLFPVLKTLTAPGFPSPIWRTSRFSRNFPAQTENGGIRKKKQKGSRPLNPSGFIPPLPLSLIPNHLVCCKFAGQDGDWQSCRAVCPLASLENAGHRGPDRI